MNATDVGRFEQKYQKTSKCWNWTGGKTGGYGVFWYEGRHHNAHRISYSISKGEIPTGLQIDHLCRNRACVNPEHLEAVTPRENLLRGESMQAKNARKTNCNSGHPLSEPNLYPEKDGSRRCKECAKAKQRRYNKTISKKTLEIQDNTTGV